MKPRKGDRLKGPNGNVVTVVRAMPPHQYVVIGPNGKLSTVSEVYLTSGWKRVDTTVHNFKISWKKDGQKNA
jgi:hypothetical protein